MNTQHTEQLRTSAAALEAALIQYCNDLETFFESVEHGTCYPPKLQAVRGLFANTSEDIVNTLRDSGDVLECSTLAYHVGSAQHLLHMVRHVLKVADSPLFELITKLRELQFQRTAVEHETPAFTKDQYDSSSSS